ncbi:hypothetical protein [Actinoplanes sp. CA-252034]|uniref:hypothetical protein n=1 Tax=Actinoplanes sp. CA-252034 TaxID=3239906 RepID=UPI003D98BB0C
MSERSYGRRDLIEAYLATRDGHGYGGYYPESSAYNAALRPNTRPCSAGCSGSSGWY